MLLDIITHSFGSPRNLPFYTPPALTVRTADVIYAASLASIYPFRLADVAPPRSGYLHFTKEPPDELRFSNSTGAKMECAASGHPEPVSAA